jgi:hypothetical protein
VAGFEPAIPSSRTRCSGLLALILQHYSFLFVSPNRALFTAYQWRLATGDKRAIRALEILLDQEPVLNYLVGKVICLEQLIERLVTKFGAAEIRKKICGEAAIDRSLGICFECMNASAAENTGLEGLQSYIADLRKTANRVLCP